MMENHPKKGDGGPNGDTPSIKTRLIEALATELALSMEHYEDNPEGWFPESLALIDEAVEYLKLHNRPLPEPVQMIMDRRVDRK